jgi:Bacterial Ig-like domain (group 2)
VLPARVAAIRISDHPSAAVRDRTFVLGATPVDRWGRPVDGRNVVWSSSDAHVAVVTAGGKVNPLRPGSVVLTASCEGVTESVRIEVAGTPAPATLTPVAGSNRRHRRHRRSPVLATVAAGVLAGGAFGLLAYDGRRGASSAEVASVAMTNQAATPLPDSVTIPAVEVRPDRSRARPAGRTRAPRAARPAVATISIEGGNSLHAGDTARLSAVLLDPNGDTLEGRPVVWRSSNTTVAMVDPRTGEVRGESPGTAVILAESGGESSFAEMTVLPVPVATVRVRGARPLTVGESLLLLADTRDRSGTALADRDVVWASSDSTIARVHSTSGVVTARSPGSVEVSARSEGKSARVRLAVSARATPAGAPDADDRARVERTVLSGVETCYDALRAKDVARVTALYHPDSDNDRENLERLSRILRTEEWSAEVSERVFGQRRIRGDRAAMEFTLRLSWRDAFGGRHSSRPVFRAEFARQDAEWRMGSCRIVGDPGL